MQDGEHCAVALGIDKADAFPASLQRAGLRLAVADHRRNDQLGIIHHRAKGMDEDITQLAAFVDGARRRRADVARDSSRRGKLTEELQQSRLVAGDLGEEVRIAPLQIHIGHQSRAAVAGTRHVNDIEAVLFNQPVQVT